MANIKYANLFERKNRLFLENKRLMSRIAPYTIFRLLFIMDKTLSYQESANLSFYYTLTDVNVALRALRDILIDVSLFHNKNSFLA